MTTTMTFHDPVSFIPDGTGRPAAFVWRSERWRVLGQALAADVEFYGELTHSPTIVSEWRFRAAVDDGSDVADFQARRVPGGWEIVKATF